MKANPNGKLADQSRQMEETLELGQEFTPSPVESLKETVRKMETQTHLIAQLAENLETTLFYVRQQLEQPPRKPSSSGHRHAA